MGKKHPAGAAKQRPGITRFLERRATTNEAGTVTDGRFTAVLRSADGRASTPGKQLLDNVLLSQDADDGGMQVVWASSPTAAFSPQKAAGGSQEGSISVSQQQAENSQASRDGFRKTLIQAVQRAPSDADLDVGVQLQQPIDDMMLEPLSTRRSSHRSASTSSPIARTVAPADPKPRGGFAEGPDADAMPISDYMVMQEVLASTDTDRTPAAGGRPCRAVVAQSGDAIRPVTCTPSVLTVGGKRPLRASGKKAASGGNKRRALLDILDQVEFMVKHGSSAGPSQPSAAAQRYLRIEADMLPTASTEEMKYQACPDAETPRPADAEAVAGNASHATPAARCAPGAQASRPALNRWEAALLNSETLDEGYISACGVAAPELTTGSLQKLPMTADYVMPTQPIRNELPDFNSGRNCNTSDHISKGRVAAVAVNGNVMPDRCFAMPPPVAPMAARALMSGSGLATQPLIPEQVLATPIQDVASLVRGNHPPAGGPAAAMPQTVAVRERCQPSRAATTGKCTQVVCPEVCGEVSREVPVSLAAVDDDDDAFWGDVDVDALVANATSWQPNTTGAELIGSCPTGINPAFPPEPSHQAAPGIRPDEQWNAHRLQDRRNSPPKSEMPVQQQQTESGPPCGQYKGALSARTPVRSEGGSSPAVPLLGEREEVHFVVLEVEELPSGHGKVLRCFNEYKGVETRVCLRDMWADQEVEPGDTVNVVGGRVLADVTCKFLEVSATEGLLILHPDVLLSGTTVCTAIRCARQAWVQERVASGPGGEKALIGSMLHELLQRSLRAAIAGKLDKNVMITEARSILATNTDKMLESQQDEASVLAYIMQQLDAIISWCNSYITPNPSAPLGGRIEVGSGGTPTFCRVAEVLDIEESIWAPKYGLKGQLDASLRVKLSTGEPLQVSVVQNCSQQHPAHFHGLRGRRTSEGAQTGAVPTGDGVTGVIGAGRRQPDMGCTTGKPQHLWSASKAASGAVPSAEPHGHRPVEASLDAGGGVIAPFEFKTGKDRHEHRAQVLLYLLLMEDRYQTAVQMGLLWNSQKPTMQAVRYAHHELASLIMHRNRLAAYLVGAAREPPAPLQGSEADRKCEYCGVSSTCALYLAAAGTSGAVQSDAPLVAPQSADMDLHQSLREKLLTVSPSSAAFFAHWVGLVDLEELSVRGSRTDMWALSGAQREQLGGCVSQLLLERELPPNGEAENQRFVYIFRRRTDTNEAASGPGSAEASLDGGADAEIGSGGFLGSGFVPGDSALLGVEGRHAAAARVTVVEVTKDTLTLSCRKELKYIKLGDAPRAMCGRCTNGPHPPAALGCCNACAGTSERVTWRLDRDESASLFAQLRLNLALLCVAGAGSGWSGGCGHKVGAGDAARARRESHLAQLRKLIIGLEPPQQGLGRSSLCASSQLSASAASTQLQDNSYLREHAHKMNGEQLEAVQRVLAMQDYAILLGMPGTGKTTTIVHIIRALVETRATILVASYTNSAVDNILMKLIGTPVSFVRLGSAQAVHPAIRPYMPGGEYHPDTSVAGLQEVMGRVNVVGCTCLSVHHPLLAGRTFGVCILDEASQVTLPASIGSLALARSFLLVGDHYQLSPLVVSREAAQGGLGISLFRRLSEAHPQAVVTLRSQYRMAADIMALSNALVYNGRMLCGSKTIAEATLRLPYLTNLGSHGAGAAQESSPCSPWPCDVPVPTWLMALMKPDCRVVFLDTDSVVGCREMVLRDGIINKGEVHLVYAITSALITAGLPPSDIGIASPYKAQVVALQQALAGLGVSSLIEALDESTDSGGAVEVLTVDKYQGRDKSAILLSLVRCNTSHRAGRLLTDWQRLNVAITRARTKLVLLGSAATLASIPLLQDMLLFLKCKGWIQLLPVDCLAQLPVLPTVKSGV
ncbi:hypothetical protein VaNZ11_000304 [Volvox africanus]|uniref:DNA helicase n=1 Tax=Volvox africanus TaxID=51714 RepID=A0ABQ5RLR3_9CHLO|nr:hypothetical protein VaNZ11_000304 [Volvox africanus]